MLPEAREIFLKYDLYARLFESLSAYELRALSWTCKFFYELVQDVLNHRKKEVQCIPYTAAKTVEVVKKFCKEQLKVPPAYCIVFLNEARERRYNTPGNLREMLCVPKSCQVFIITPYVHGNTACVFIPSGLSDFSMEPIMNSQTQFSVPCPVLAVLLAKKQRFRVLNFNPNVFHYGADVQWKLKHHRSLVTRYDLVNLPAASLGEQMLGFVFGGKNVEVKSIMRNEKSNEPSPENYINNLKSYDERPEIGATDTNISNQEKCTFAFQFVHYDYCSEEIDVIHDQDAKEFRNVFPGVPLISIHYGAHGIGHENLSDLRSKTYHPLLRNILDGLSHLKISTIVMVSIDVNKS